MVSLVCKYSKSSIILNALEWSITNFNSGQIYLMSKFIFAFVKLHYLNVSNLIKNKLLFSNTFFNKMSHVIKVNII